MKTSHKATLSLVISVFLSVVFAVLAFTGLFDLIEARLSADFTLAMRVILVVSFFLTVYLTVFLLFNLKQDPVIIIQNRLKRLQINLIEQFYEGKTDADWARWGRELEQRRNDIVKQLKQGVKIVSGDEARDIDLLINKSWNELLSAMGSQQQEKEKIEDMEPLEELEEVGIEDYDIEDTGGIEEVDDIDEVAGIEDAEGIEEIEGLKEAEGLEDDEEFAELIEEPEGFLEAPDIDIATLISQIEFGPDFELDENPEDISSHVDLEIVSPFSTMLSDFSKLSISEDILEPAPNLDPTLFGKPLFSVSTGTKIETLKAFSDEESDYLNGDIIKERGGVHYINGDALRLGAKAPEKHNQSFQNLVDSIVAPAEKKGKG